MALGIPVEDISHFRQPFLSRFAAGPGPVLSGMGLIGDMYRPRRNAMYGMSGTQGGSNTTHYTRKGNWFAGLGAVHVADTVIENGYARVAPADTAGYADSLRTMTVGPFADLTESGAFIKTEATLNPGATAPPGTANAGEYYSGKLKGGYFVLVPRSFDPMVQGQKLILVKTADAAKTYAPPTGGDYAVLFTPADAAQALPGMFGIKWTPVMVAGAAIVGAGVIYMLTRKKKYTSNRRRRHHRR